MTHELKTPLASIRLQSEVLQSLISSDQKKPLEITQRLVEDTQKFENQMDKILQLSRLEGGGNLNISPIQIEQFLSKTIERWAFDTTIEFTPFGQLEILADAFALDLILRNLLENTKHHSPDNKASISHQVIKNQLTIVYQDGSLFTGDKSKLGKLFYKYQSPKGSGIGLYLINKLLLKMHGKLEIIHQPQLIFKITLPLKVSAS